MTTPHSPRATLWICLFLAGLAAGLPACNKAGKRQVRNTAVPERVNQALGRGQHLAFDGDLGDWPTGVATVADEDWIYFRINLEGAGAPIQASPETLELWLDADASPKTGEAMAAPAEAAGMGVDAVVAYSPPDPQKPGQTRPGVRITAPSASGAPVELTHAQIGLASLPTYSSDHYEVRLSRHIDQNAAPPLAKAVAASGRARAMFVLKDASGKIVGWSDPETFQKPAASRTTPLSDAPIPAKAAGTVRIVTYNVFKSELTKNPATFARIFQVLDPDIILCQEWDTDAASASSWFTAIVTGQHPWRARTGPDVVIISPHEIAPLGPDSVTYSGAEAPVRFVAALVKTPGGDVAVGTAHLKCCGTTGSPEDQRRLAESQAINAAMKTAMPQVNTPMRVLGGDLNLVGAAGPLGALAAGLDTDGSDMAVVQPMVLGDPSLITWVDPKSEFPPGRLDYLLVSDSSTQVVNAFVLDTSKLSARSLARVGMDRGDTAASDHLPVVVDIRPR